MINHLPITPKISLPRYSKQSHSITVQTQFNASPTSIHNRSYKNGRWTNQTVRTPLSINFIFATGIPYKRSSSECADPLHRSKKKKRKKKSEAYWKRAHRYRPRL